MIHTILLIQLTIKFELWFGFIYTLLNVVIMNLIVSTYNRLVGERSKISPDVLDKSKKQASWISLGIWSLQLLVLGLPVIFFFPLYMYFIFDGLYLALFIVFTSRNRKKSITESFESIEEKLEKKRQEEQEKENVIQQEKTVLEVKGLQTYFYTEEGIVRAVENVSFKIYENEVVGLVGETGCGKSVTALSILQLVKQPGKINKGQIIFEGEDLLQKSKKEMLEFRGNKITMMFQDPLNSLNPVFKVGDQIIEIFLLHKEMELLAESKIRVTKLEELRAKLQHENDEKKQAELKKVIKEANEKTNLYVIAKEWAIDIISKVGIADAAQIVDRYPFELSGGMRQRVMIAMGLSCSPRLLVADEPTTALDVTIQAQILDLLRNLTSEFGTSILMITHDLGIISDLCNRVCVMYSGSVVESGDVIRLFKEPKHPYTKGLMAAIPRVGLKQETLQTIPGSVPNLIYPPAGCRFHPRCDYCFEPCDSIIPDQYEVEKDYFVACHLFNPEFQNSNPLSIKNTGEN